MTSSGDSKDEAKNQPQVQAGGDGARRGGRGTRNGAPEGHPAGGSGQYKRGQNVICKVGQCQYDGGYSVTILETGDFGFLKASTKLSPNDEIEAVFVCWSPEGRYNQYWKYPVLGLPDTATPQEKAKFINYELIDSQKMNELIGEPGCR